MSHRRSRCGRSAFGDHQPGASLRIHLLSVLLRFAVLVADTPVGNGVDDVEALLGEFTGKTLRELSDCGPGDAVTGELSAATNRPH